MTHVQVMMDGSKQLKEMEIESGSLIHHSSEWSYQAPTTGTIYGMLMNDKNYVEAMDGTFHHEPYHHPPIHPIMYIKPINTVNGHLKEVPMPKETTSVQINATLGMVIGKTAVNVAVDEALDYVSGYTIVNDVSILHDHFHRPNIKNKVRDGFCPIGPWIVEKKALPNPNNVTIRVSVNGEMKQEINTRHVVREVPEVLSDVSSFMTLTPGDVLLLGIFDGAPNAHIGDTVRIEIDGVGALENSIVSEDEWVSGGDVL